MVTYLLKILEWVNNFAKTLLDDKWFCRNRSYDLFYAALQIILENQNIVLFITSYSFYEPYISLHILQKTY